MNIKPPHLKNDSNPFRQRKNEEQKQQMKDTFSQEDLMDIPKGIELLNETIYESLVRNLDDLGLGVHLKKLDVPSLVAISNTMEIISDCERNIKDIGNFQKIVTREGHEKWVATPFAQTRSSNMSQLQSQLKQLQLDPQGGQLLKDAVLNDVNMLSDEIDEDDELTNILERLS